MFLWNMTESLNFSMTIVTSGCGDCDGDGEEDPGPASVSSAAAGVVEKNRADDGDDGDNDDAIEG